MNPTSVIHPPSPAETLNVLRHEVRAFVAQCLEEHRFVPTCDAWHTGWDEEFTREIADRGWVGMTLPTDYGGQGRTSVERHVVIEELLISGAPLAAHWAADRQMGQAILRHGTPGQRERFLPPIADGSMYFAIGMSEPEAGSDLANARMKADRVPGGWILNGRKLWVTGAHRAHAIMVLARTAPRDENRRQAGFSQFVVMTDTHGLEIQPIISMAGEHHFNEILFEGVFVPDDLVLGTIDDGWRQVTAELANERSGPERFLSTYPLLEAVVAAIRSDQSRRHHARVGELLVELTSLRRLSLDIATRLQAGEAVDVHSALVKDMGTKFEGKVVEVARDVLAVEADPTSENRAARLLGQATLQRPSFTLRGGTNEVLRGLVARGMGVR